MNNLRFIEKLFSQNKEWPGKKSVDTRDSLDINFVRAVGCNSGGLVRLYS
jgi:hypothetical protein